MTPAPATDLPPTRRGRKPPTDENVEDYAAIIYATVIQFTGDAELAKAKADAVRAKRLTEII